MAKKGKTWRDPLTKKERKHLSESGIRTKTQMVEQVAFLKKYEIENKDNPNRAILYPCWECKQIAKKLGLWDTEKPIEKKYTEIVIDRIISSPISKCNCGYTNEINCGCGGVVHLVDKFENNRFTRNVCDNCGCMISSYGLHLLHMGTKEEGA